LFGAPHRRKSQSDGASERRALGADVFQVARARGSLVHDLGAIDVVGPLKGDSIRVRSDRRAGVLDLGGEKQELGRIGALGGLVAARDLQSGGGLGIEWGGGKGEHDDQTHGGLPHVPMPRYH